MRVTTMVTMATLAVSAPAEGLGGQAAPTVVVYVQEDGGVPPLVLLRAQSVAAGMFAGIGIHLKWQSGKPRRGKGAGEIIGLRFDFGAPSSVSSGAMAYATPMKGSGISIHILYERVRDVGSANLAPVLLGHIMAHEITHVLQGQTRHSPEGLMKAHWDHDDFHQMALGPLPFATLDVELLRFHMARRAAGIAP